MTKGLTAGAAEEEPGIEDEESPGRPSIRCDGEREGLRREEGPNEKMSEIARSKVRETDLVWGEEGGSFAGEMRWSRRGR